ncbi:YafY family transcriptional regulator [Brenneria izadpanahii]|uniref:YafY family transcriptional regulator n=1 Tax=Brenneria izadpanahii TaxID=2722756 RepID=A0ABX7UVG4_9GAMM|nr:YafY family protein [Brenneria izadpanahii]QTF08547.1 YafY family transcriptional regulator [Brenneria izadpanahii]
MSRAQRLLDLIQILRNHRFPVAGANLAAELGISLRTLYRDIGTLQAQGADIEGEPGLGYILRPGFMLPPLMFSEEEIEALVLGSRWVADRGDERLSSAARCALAKISDVLPDGLRNTLDSSTLLVGPESACHTDDKTLSLIRQCIRAEHKLEIHYRDLKDAETTRIVWPFALGYFEHTRVLAAWCETRQAFRHFRTERITELTRLKQRYPRRRQALLKEWREAEGIPSQ